MQKKDLNMMDTSFELPDFGFSDKEECKVSTPYDIIKEYDAKIESLSKELAQVRFERDRLKTAIDVLSVYIKSIN